MLTEEALVTDPDALAAMASGADLARTRTDETITPTVDVEVLAEAVHQAYLETADRLGWPVKPDNDVPYAELSEDSKELDRASVRAVLNAMRNPRGA